MKYFIRWLLFFLVGLPIQALVYSVYPLIAIYFFFVSKKKTDKYFNAENFNNPISPKRSLDEIARIEPKIRDQYFLDNDDTHNALTHAQLWTLKDYKHLAEGGLEMLVKDSGSLYRRAPIDQEYLPVSGDCLSAWCYAYTISETKRPDLVEKVAFHYLKNCFGLEHYNGLVSARSSNSGVNYVFDGWKGINQPCFGPQYYTSASILSLAAKELKGIKKVLFQAIYTAHYVLMGGWLWWCMPIIYSPTNYIYYTHHITALNLFTISKTKKFNEQNRSAMRMIAKHLSPAGNCNPFIWSLGSIMDCMDSPDVQIALNVALRFATSDAFMWQLKPINSKEYFEHYTEDKDPTQLRAILDLSKK